MKTRPSLVGLLLVAGPVTAQAAQFGDFQYTSSGTAVTITKYTGPGGEATIPDTIDGLLVTGIGDLAFLRCTGLTSVVLGNSVTSIGESAFSGCAGLTSIMIPDSVTSIGDYAFLGCTGLTSVVLGNSVTRIGAGAFWACTGLTSVVLDNSVSRIGAGAFWACTGLTSVVLGNSVTSIGESAFSGCTGLTSVTIGNGVTSIGERAFLGCTGLSDLSINMTRIGSTFAGLAGLRRLAIGPSVTSIELGAFTGCTGLTSAVIGNGVTVIGPEAFWRCTGLTSVIIGNSVTSIGDIAFCDCTGLTSITIPDRVTSIGDGAFQRCTGLTNIVIPTSVTHVGNGAFTGCTGLTSVTIPNSVTSIEASAFSGCTGLTSVVIGNSVTHVGNGAFTGCTGLTSVTIPDSVTAIGQPECSVGCWGCGWGGCRWVGRDCGMGLGAFGGCTGLTNAVIGNAVTSIGAYTFAGCTGLARVTIGNSVSTIGARAFESCTNLTAITIPDSVTSLGGLVHGCRMFDDALVGPFGGCTGLTGVYIEGEGLWTGLPLFEGTSAIIYYLPGTVGWGPTYAGRPTVLWLPRIEICGFQNGLFVLTVKWARHRTVALEACTDLAKPSWSSVWTNTLSSSTASFTDPESAARPASFYRLREITPPRGEITVTGEVGEVYVIESATDAGSDFWLTRGWIELTAPTIVWQDPIPTGCCERIYRAVKVTKPVVETISNMVWIPPGRFLMGSPEGERGRSEWEGPQTRVTLTKGFWLGKYEVTQREYLAVMGNNPSYFQPPEFPEDLDRPVEQVSWEAAVTYCQKLTEQEWAAGRLATNAVYRLPTEAEWEYACRAGTTTRFSFGNALRCGDECEYCPLLDSHMWWCGNSGGQSHPVGCRLPNPWGLYDMHGNVGEWCQDSFDWEHPEYPGGAVVSPQGPTSGSDRVIRGRYGWRDWIGWYDLAALCRSSYRSGVASDYLYSDLGFRVLLAPGQ